MIAPPERLPERDAAVEAMLPHVAFDGWTMRALKAGLAEAGMPADEAALLFPLGPVDMIAVFCDLADRRMTEAAAALDETRLTARVRAIVALRLEMNRPHKEAIRRALALLALPRNAADGAKMTARTIDAIWHAAGDRSADFSWYTKRAILTAVYGTTLLFWLQDRGGDEAETLAFLERRLRGAGRIGKIRGRVHAALNCFRPTRGQGPAPGQGPA